MKNMIDQIQNIDMYDQLHTLKEILTSFYTSYKQNSTWKIRLIDSFIVFCGILFIIQLLYVILNGLFPMNSLISGLVCCIGTITLLGI